MEDRFRSLMSEAGLSKYTDKVLGLRRNSIRIQLSSASEDSINIGQSKVGGQPDLPPGIKWPEWTPPLIPRKPGLLAKLFGRKQETPQEPKPIPHAFIAQFNLSETAPFDTEKQLPDSGMLYFFYDAYESPWGYDPTHRGGWKVLYYDGDLSQLARTAPPAEQDKHSIFTPCKVQFSSEMMFPSWESAVMEKKSGMSEDELDTYSDMFRM